MSNSFTKLIQPRLPSAAIGLSGEGAGVVSLDRRRSSDNGGGRNAFTVKSAGYIPFPEGLVSPNFDEVNTADPNELQGLLAELVTSVGLPKRHRWSVALPEASTRITILTIENAPASRAELEEVLRWKTERAIAAPLDEIRIARERLTPDAQGRARYLVTAVRHAVLAEYEAIFGALNWQAGLILPRSLGEAWWLMKGHTATSGADALLVSTHRDGFTAMLLRGGQPLIVRSVLCAAEDRADELYRLLLFYRDRLAAATAPEEVSEAEPSSSSPPLETVEQLLIVGTGFDRDEARVIVAETLATTPRMLEAEDVHLALPYDNKLDFNTLAAPAGLAALAWS